MNNVLRIIFTFVIIALIMLVPLYVNLFISDNKLINATVVTLICILGILLVNFLIKGMDNNGKNGNIH